MLFEVSRTLQQDVVRARRLRPYTERVVRDGQYLRMAGITEVETMGGNRHVKSYRDLIDILINRNTLVSDPNSLFVQMVNTLSDEDFITNRKVESTDGIILMSDSAGTFCLIRRGNLWGSVLCVERDLNPESLRDHANSIFAAFDEAGWSIDRISSPSRMIEDLILAKTNYLAFPDLASGEIDYTVLDRAYNCLKGGRMECAILGMCPTVFDYDLKSAYFTILRDLPSVRSGFIEWVDSKEYIKDALFGFCRCYVCVDDEVSLGPVGVRLSMGDKQPRLFYPIGDIECWMTKDEIDMVIRSDTADVEILEGSWGVPKRESPKIFGGVSSVIDKLIDDPRSRNVAKYMASVGWGKFAYQKSPLFNPIYAAHVPASVRARVTEIGLSLGESLIAITIDGVVSTSPVDDKFLSDGSFRCDLNGETMVSLTDFFRLASNKGGNWEVDEDGVILWTHPMMFTGGRIKIPFGSTKRVGPSNLHIRDLMNNQFVLKPPSDEEAIELFLSTQEIPWDF